MSLSDRTRRVSKTHFGRAELLAYDLTLSKYVSFGYAQDTTLEIAWEQEELRAGSPAAIIDTEVTSVSVNLTCQLLEVSTENLIKLLPDSISSQDVLGTDPLEFVNDYVTLNDETDADLKYANIVDTVGDKPIVKSIDGLTTYDETDDYIVTYLTGKIHRVATGAIGDGEQVQVQYKYTDATAAVIHVGGRSCSAAAQSFIRLRAEARSKNCAFRGVEIYKAAPVSPLSIPFANTYTVLEAKFTGMDDESRPIGRNMFRWIEGSAARN